MLKLGQIICYHCNTDEQKVLNNFQENAPAIVTTAWSDTCCNAKVMYDGIHTGWKTSINLGETPGTFSIID